MTRDFRELRVWNSAMDLAVAVYAITRQLPAEEKFGLTSQLRRAVVSVASCIAEGNARASTRDYARFVSMASGSLAETETQVLLAQRLGYIETAIIQPILNDIRSLAKQLQALKSSLATKLSGPALPFPVPRSPFPA